MNFPINKKRFCKVLSKRGWQMSLIILISQMIKDFWKVVNF